MKRCIQRLIQRHNQRHIQQRIQQHCNMPPLAYDTYNPPFNRPHNHQQTRNHSTHFTSTVSRHEVLSLYRECLRTARAFHHVDERGEPWNYRLKIQVRKEFREGRNEVDPLVIARMLVVGRQSVQEIQRRFNKADKEIMDRVKRDVSRR
mmetsp:Transcript_7864/g.15725  ORF Transcript_7864/g.15725 Transcript_7864/m.15725 type:complete len:149 (+) Transcript_7864:331-777(+)